LEKGKLTNKKKHRDAGANVTIPSPLVTSVRGALSDKYGARQQNRNFSPNCRQATTKLVNLKHRMSDSYDNRELDRAAHC
jgi:hypothetical protein